MPSFIDEHDSGIEELASTFQYKNVTKGKIITWLKQFEESHQTIALKLLQSIRFYDTAQMHDACKNLCRIIKAECGENLDNTLFMGLGPAGKSGSAMLSRFRHANSMHLARYHDKFKFSSAITSLPSSFSGNLVFLDDFIGSGSQAAASLLDIVSIAPPATKIFLLVIAGYQSAIDNICGEVECNVFSVDTLQDHEKLFSDANTNFTQAEKAILRDYCKRTGSTYPYGYRNVGSLVVFCDSAPNNTPSILIHEGDTWKPLFVRV